MSDVDAVSKSASLALLFSALLFVPSFTMVAFGQSSMAMGLLLYLAVLCFYLLMAPLRVRVANASNCRKVIFLFALLAIIFMHSSWPMIRRPDFQVGRFFGGYLIVFVMCAAALGFVERLISASAEDVSRWVNQALWLLVINAVVGLSGIKIFPYTSYKPVGVFSEPSHFALVLAPVLAYVCAAEAKNYRWVLVFFFVWGLIIENLTTLVVVSFCASINIRLSISVKSFFVAIAVFLFAFIGFYTVDIEYFLSRLVISEDSNNLSVLVLLQGWDYAVMMLKQTAGWGVGFQQFGLSGENTDISAKFASMGLEGLNQFDGGSTAAKIIGEFGVLGVIGVFVVCVLAGRAYQELRLARRNRGGGGALFLSACLCMFPIELFVRGVGYFSPTGFLLLCAVMGVYCCRQTVPSKKKGLI